MCDTKVTVEGCLITIKHKDQVRQVYDAPWMFSGYSQEEWDAVMIDEVNRIIGELNGNDNCISVSK